MGVYYTMSPFMVSRRLFTGLPNFSCLFSIINLLFWEINQDMISLYFSQESHDSDTNSFALQPSSLHVNYLCDITTLESSVSTNTCFRITASLDHTC